MGCWAGHLNTAAISLLAWVVCSKLGKAPEPVAYRCIICVSTVLLYHTKNLNIPLNSSFHCGLNELGPKKIGGGKTSKFDIKHNIVQNRQKHGKIGKIYKKYINFYLSYLYYTKNPNIPLNSSFHCGFNEIGLKKIGGGGRLSNSTPNTMYLVQNLQDMEDFLRAAIYLL